MSSSYNLNTLDVPIMRNQRNGKIVNITSVGGRIAFPVDSIYHGTRFALEGLSECEFVIIPRLKDVVVLLQSGPMRFVDTGFRNNRTASLTIGDVQFITE